MKDYYLKSINMKKTRFKQAIFLGFVILVSSFLLWNCETEEEFQDLQANTPEKPIKSIQRHVIPLQSLMVKNHKAFEILTGLVKEESKLGGKSEEYSDEYDLHYDLSEIYVIEGNTYEQFSFVVRSSDQQENQFKNYLLYVYPNNDYQQFLVTYQYNDIEEGSFNPVNITELQGSQLLTRSVVNCPNDAELVPQTGTVCTYTLCTGDNHHMYGQSGCTCGVEDPCEPATEICVEQTYYVWQCGGGSTGGTGNDNTNDPNNDNGQTGGGDDTSGNDTGGGSPVFPVEDVETPMDRILRCMETSFFDRSSVTMPSSLIDSLDVSRFCQIPLDNFITSEGCSLEVQSFAIDAARACLNGGIVDYEDEIIYDSSFTNTKTECIHNKLKVNSNNIYSSMLSIFSSSTQKRITFSINNSIGADWGIVKGNMQSQNDYRIIINKDIVDNNGSNLVKFITLSHELIHAYMYDALEDAGVLSFDANGDPIISVNCPSNNVNLNTLSVKDRFVTLICAMNSAGTLSQQWIHDIFNSNVFSVQDYRQKLEDMIVNDYDWNSESSTFINKAMNIFGTNWKQEVAKAVSWVGLEGTNDYITYLNSYSTQINKFIYISNIRIEILNTNNICP
jgi:hypothetical protein